MRPYAGPFTGFNGFIAELREDWEIVYSWTRGLYEVAAAGCDTLKDATFEEHVDQDVAVLMPD